MLSFMDGYLLRLFMEFLSLITSGTLLHGAVVDRLNELFYCSVLFWGNFR